MASFFARLYEATRGQPAPLADTPFTDVEPTSSAFHDIGRIYGLDITGGTTPTTYSPNQPVTREQMASFLARLYEAITGRPAPTTDTPFTDVARSSFAYDDIGRIYGLGVATGITPTTYAPARVVTHAQMASFLDRLYEAITGEPAAVTNTPFTDNGFGQADAPAGSFGSSGGADAAVRIAKGGLGPTSLGPGLGTPCASGTSTCRWLDIELSGFDPGEYTLSCSHDGWRGSGPSTWWTFEHTIGNSGAASISNQCFIDFATLTGNGAHINVRKAGALVAVSNSLK